MTFNGKSIAKGTEIELFTHGRRFYGSVISAQNYGTPEKDNWYIEFKDHDDQDKPRYWRQETDDGSLLMVDHLSAIHYAPIGSSSLDELLALTKNGYVTVEFTLEEGKVSLFVDVRDKDDVPVYETRLNEKDAQWNVHVGAFAREIIEGLADVALTHISENTPFYGKQMHP